MDNLIKAIKKELLKRFTDAGWDEIKITMTINGDVLTINPCSQVCDNITDESQVEWYLVYGSSCTELGGDSLDKLCEQLATYEEMLNSLDNSKKKLRAFFEKHILPHKNDKDWKSYESDAFEYYSDWHKDIYGYRPHGFVCGEYINPHQ